MIFPFFWMISTAVKTPSEAATVPPMLWPKHPHWGNFVDAFKSAPFARYLFNSLLVTFCTTAAQMFTSILAAFAFSKLKFWGKNVIFMIFLSTMMVPIEMLIIPNYVTLTKAHLINSYLALILPWSASFFTVFTLRQAFNSVPPQVYYAAKIDGASDWNYLWRVLVPICRSSIVAMSILEIIASWNDFLWPMIVTNDANMRTLPVAVSSFSNDVGTNYPFMMAAATFVVIPMIILYLILQKYIIQGITKGGLVG
ncbi:sugar ABC transporter permease [Xylocopilactobacillus apicola]|uniref:Sugar ABC transporter permease n=2 Tax=Xylocopilactobacillus apicola TaxID=2932184 RepID=A0AAU9DB25_9LACO|nr:sugar ABC transporter permease [Xylocopilactobacillus apicola]